jgi:hypothetical protein
VAARCGCKDEGDDIVFGPVHECTVDPSVRVERVGFVTPVIAALQQARALRQSDFALSPTERPYEYVLDESERRGD